MTLLPTHGPSWRGLAAGGLSALAATLALLVALPGAASATYPGTNGRIAFDEDSGNGSIYIANSDGTGKTNLIPGFSDSAGFPEFSPDGTRIAFLSEGELWMVNPDGTGLHDLNLSFVAQGGPTWSPDGTKIALSAALPGTPQPIGLKIVNSTTGAVLDTLTPPNQGAGIRAEYVSPAWNPANANQIAVTRAHRVTFDQMDLALVPTSGAAPTMLTNTEAPAEFSPDWAPDGSTLAFALAGVDDSLKGIYSIAAGGGATTRLTVPPDVCPGAGTNCGSPIDDVPFYSPDGSSLGFFRLGSASPFVPEAIYIAAANGSNPQSRFVNVYNGSWGGMTESGLVVNTNEDAADTNTTDDRCDADDSQAGDQCTLRAAIAEANAREGADEISFDIDPGGRQTIAPDTALPEIDDQVTIDGSTQPGAPAGEPGIMLDGSGMAAKRDFLLGSIGLAISKAGNGSLIKALGIGNFGIGAQIKASGVTMQGNWIGIFDSLGAQLEPNGIGIKIGGSGITIGGPGDGIPNVISGNAEFGVLFEGTKAKINELIANIIGPPPNLDPPAGFVSNEEAGVALTKGATNNTIGGETQADGNVIGNNGVGVLVDDAGTGNEILSNGIGAPLQPVDLGEDDDFGNDTGILALDDLFKKREDGLLISMNTISGNGGAGVETKDSTGVQVSGNAIGTFYGQDDCQPQLSNGSGAAAGEAHQVVTSVSGNLHKQKTGQSKIFPIKKLGEIIFGGAGPLGAKLGGNVICGGIGDAALILSAQTKGIFAQLLGNQVEGGSGTSLLGRLGATIEGNTFTDSSASGVIIKDAVAAALKENLLYDNADRGIALSRGAGPAEPAEPDPEDTDRGPNDLQNYPFLSLAQQGPAEVKVETSLLSKPRGTYRLEFFGAQLCGPGHQGEALASLGTRTVKTDGFGVYQELNIVPTGAEAFNYVIATVTHLDGNTPVTSELSRCRSATPASEPAVGIAPASLTVKGNKVRAVVDCLDTSPCTGEASVLDRESDEEYGTVEIGIPFNGSHKVTIKLNAAGKEQLDEFNRLNAEIAAAMTTSFGDVQAQIDVLLRALK